MCRTIMMVAGVSLVQVACLSDRPEFPPATADEADAGGEDDSEADASTVDVTQGDADDDSSTSDDESSTGTNESSTNTLGDSTGTVDDTSTSTQGNTNVDTTASDPSGDGGADQSDAGGGEDATEPPPGPCDTEPCQNGASCKANGAEYLCTCSPGFDGELCENDIDECASEPCTNGGACQDGVGDYTCVCPTTMTGKNCELARFEILPAGFEPTALSGDGKVVVGVQANKAAKYLNGAIVNLGAYIGDNESRATAVSEDGDIIVGVSTDTRSSASRPVRWDGNTISELSNLSEDHTCEARDVSADGSTIVGHCLAEGSSRGTVVRWVEGMAHEIEAPSGTDSCAGPIVSGDGSAIFGGCSVKGDSQPFRWTQSEGAVLLTAPRTDCSLKAVTADGTAAAGWCSGGGNSGTALEWSAGNGMEFINVTSLDETSNNSAAYDISSDGSFIVGFGMVGGTYAQAAVRWDAEREPQLLTDLLESAGGTEPSDNLRTCEFTSSNGQTLMGAWSSTSSGDSTTGHWIVRLE